MFAPAFTLAVAAAPSAPQRVLVYSFTYGATTDLHIHSSGIGAINTDIKQSPGMVRAAAASGVSDNRDGTADQGTITVDVMGEDANKGLVVRIRENAQNSRSAKPTECVVYGTTATICDPNGTVRLEETSILRLLASNFVDPAKIDAHQQWSVDVSSGQFDNASLFTIAKNHDGRMTIDEQRTSNQHVGGKMMSTNTSSTIVYDYPKLVPTSLKQFTQLREPRGINELTGTIEIDETLQSDSMKKAARTP